MTSLWLTASVALRFSPKSSSAPPPTSTSAKTNTKALYSPTLLRNLLLATFALLSLPITSLTPLGLLTLTLSSFAAGTLTPPTFKKAVHPLIFCALATNLGIFIKGSLTATSSSYLALLSTYSSGILSAGGLLSFFLGEERRESSTSAPFRRGAKRRRRRSHRNFIIPPLRSVPSRSSLRALSAVASLPFLTFVTKPSPVAGPAVVSFATSVYDKRSLILSNLKAVLTSTVLGSAYGVFGTGAIMRCLRVKSSDVKVAALSRQVTSPLAMAIQGMLVAGGDPGLAVATVVVTGVVGASVGPRILDALGVEDGKVRTPPPVRGSGKYEEGRLLCSATRY